MTTYIPTQIAGYRGWILSQYHVAPFRDGLEALLVSNFTARTPHLAALQAQSPDREVYRLKIHQAEVYLKRYYVRTWKQRLQTLFHAHKAQKAWRIGRTLGQRGIPTPLPVAYLARGLQEHILVTQGIVNGRPLADYIRQGLGVTDKNALLRSVAAFLAHLHVAGVYHGDFTAGNILAAPLGFSDDVSPKATNSPPGRGRGGFCRLRAGGNPPLPLPGGEFGAFAAKNPCLSAPSPSQEGKAFRIYLIDLDAVRSTHWISEQRRLKNLDELGRNFLDRRVLSTTARGRFLKFYLQANPQETRTFRPLFKRVWQRTQGQLARLGEQFAPPVRRNPVPLTKQADGGGHWHLQVCPPWQAAFPTLATVFELLSRPAQVLQENNRGVVFLMRHRGTLLVAKRSKIQENKRWAQLTSLYRKGEGARLIANMTRLYALGLPVPEPVLVLEQKRAGFVVASWSVYRYLEGQACTCAESPLIAKMLEEIHARGWVHRDPHVKNFLWDGAYIRIIDCARARPWRFRYAQMYDVVLLDKCCPGSRTSYDLTSAAARVYRLAKFHNNLIVRWRRLKRMLRNAKIHFCR